jgi:predicted small metal-binding protein
MVFRLACGDVMPGCSARFESTDRDQLMGQVAAHAASAHGITDVTPEIRRAIDDHISVAS